MICTKAKVKSTGEIVLLREPYHGEFISSLYEPDYIQIDINGNTIHNNLGEPIKYDIDEIDISEYIFDTDLSALDMQVTECIDKDIIRNILSKTDVVETKCKSILTPDKSSWYYLKGCCIELIEILNEIKDVVK